MEPILLTATESVATLTLNRPDKANALSLAMWRALPDLVRQVSDDGDIKILVVRGAGERVFSAGADIQEFKDVYATPETAKAYNAAVRAGQQALSDCPKPVLAMVYGPCVGGGCGIALCCDLRFAADTARFGITPAKLGLAYSFADTRQLVETVGPARAKDILFSGRLIPAAEAMSLGLVDRVVPAGKLSDAVADYAKQLGAVSQYSLRTAKATINAIARGADAATPDLLDRFEASFQGQDFQEGYRAFLEKRPPSFSYR